jgi:dTDP-4-dehydrorhamnose reductase
VGKKVLLLGKTGKVGSALDRVIGEGYDVTGKNSKDFDAVDFEGVRRMIREEAPDIVLNTVAYLGIDPCEKEPEHAFRTNALYPKVLAELSAEMGFLLVHFSTDAVFNDEKGDFYTEEDAPVPLNVYGLTKYGGDCFIQSAAKSYYIFRISVLFGETPKNTQFVEKMVQKVKEGQKVLRISDDIVSSPTYNMDLAAEVKRIIEEKYPFGLYHIANEGKGTLYELMKEIVVNAGIEVDVQKASYNDFPFVGRKNTNTPITSVKLKPLRPWKEAVKEYCKGGSFKDG